MIKTLAERVNRIKPSPTIAISSRAHALQAAGKPVINLSIGEPDFDTPEHIKEAAIRSIRDGYTKYTDVDGIKELRAAVVDKYLRENQLKYEINQILISCGAKHSFFNLLSAVINPGDEVIIPTPYWVSYPDMVRLMDGTPVFIEAQIAQNFKITSEQLEAAITPKTRMVIINSPSNPTGMVYTIKELNALAQVILKHPQIIVVSDDMYERNVWNHLPFANILNVCPELYDQCMVINGASKTYAMTGWRIGYAAGPSHIIAAMKKAQSQSTSNPANASQYAALAALTGDQNCVKMMTNSYHERHDFVIGELKKMPGIQCIPADGAFYAFPSIKGLLNKPHVSNDLEFAEFLLNEAEIAVIPGSAFGAPGYIRICYAASMDNLIQAMLRMNQALTKLL